MSFTRIFSYLLLLLYFVSFASDASNAPPTIREYIKNNWQRLSRDHSDLLSAAKDNKIKHGPHDKWLVYLPASESIDDVQQRLKQRLSPDDFKQLAIKHLPKNYRTAKPGLLYLPKPYVVPGGRFNEMYGWDSYFIVVGLLADNETLAAKNMIDNFIYEIEHYGTVLNANRSYYLTRSQPPLVSEMVLAYYRKTHDKELLKTALPALLKLERYWTTGPHLIKDIGLSRYYAFGDGPAVEVSDGELDQAGKSQYVRVKEYFATHHLFDYSIEPFYQAKTGKLTPAFYKADRTIRESGFDLTNKFGPFGAGITQYAPVGLNSLIYQMQLDIAKIAELLSNPKLASQYRKKAQTRAELINKYMWDSTLGFYFDYNYIKKKRRPYIFATTFYPLWAGIASQQQAQRIVKNLPTLEAPGGITTSAYVTGEQWDAPFGWAPLNYFAVKGLARYHFDKAAKRISNNFLSLIEQEYQKYGVIVEKYNVRSRTSYLDHEVRYGYVSNEIGFGWTNGVYLALNQYR